MNPREVLRWVGANGRRIAVAVAGAVLIVAGVVFMVLPGPGLLLVGAGLTVLATEYAWAERALRKLQKQAALANKSVQRRRQRKQAARANPYAQRRRQHRR